MKKLLAIVLMVVMIFPSAVFAEEKVYENEGVISYLDMVFSHIEENYKFGVTKEELYEAALKELVDKNPELFESAVEGAFESLDKHSEFYDPEEMKQLMSVIEASACGIGVMVQEQNGKVVVLEPISGSPAEKAGILANDVIVSVDETEIAGQGLTYAQSLIKGEKGTTVKIGIERKGVSERIYFTIVRDVFEEDTVVSTIVEDGEIAYIVINRFSMHTDKELKEVLDEVDNKGIKKLIIDLRNNGGGEANAMIEMLRMFCPKGPIFNIEYKDSKKNETYYSNKDNSKKYKMVVLVNENSASASEAFAGSLQDTKVAKIVGENTYGKGTVQIINGLLTGGGFKLTVASYTTAKGNEVDKVGIKPDYEVKNRFCALKDSSFVKDIPFAEVINENSSAEDIKIIEERFRYLDIYTGEVDGVFDEKTVEGIKAFQRLASLPETGILDITTQVDLHNKTRMLRIQEDHQYNKAIELLK